VHDAEVTARALLKSSPDDIDAHKLLGRIYLRQLGEGEKRRSVDLELQQRAGPGDCEFEKIVALQPKSVEDHMVLGQLYTVKHQPEKAEAEFKTAQDIEPESEEVVLNLARLYAESGDLQHAVKAIEAVPVDGRTPKMEFTLGALYDQMKQPKDAIAAYKRAEDMEPGDLQTMDALAQALLNNDQLDEALKEYKELAEADPENTEALVHIGAEIQAPPGQVRRCAGHRPQGAQDRPQLAWKRDLTKGCCSTFWAASTTPSRPTSRWSTLTSHANGAYTDEEKNNRSIFLERLGTVYLEENKTDPGSGGVPEDDRHGRQLRRARLPGTSGRVSRRPPVR
jgi:tetratricopeptide (TPR) repeat protein